MNENFIDRVISILIEQRLDESNRARRKVTKPKIQAAQIEKLKDKGDKGDEGDEGLKNYLRGDPHSDDNKRAVRTADPGLASQHRRDKEMHKTTTRKERNKNKEGEIGPFHPRTREPSKEVNHRGEERPLPPNKNARGYQMRRDRENPKPNLKGT